jgi:hypothetical protein
MNSGISWWNMTTVEILQKFNIVCRVKKSNELKQTEMYDYYVPFLIPTESTADVVTMFKEERRNKTSKKHLSHHKAIFETAIHVLEIENTAFVF